MKQRIAATMLIALLPLSLAACGGQKSDSPSTTPSAEASTSAAAPTDAYKSASSSISNADVKNAVDDLAKDAQAVTDQIKAVYVENDLSKLGEYTTAIQNMTSHQETLSNLCDVNN